MDPVASRSVRITSLDEDEEGSEEEDEMNNGNEAYQKEEDEEDDEEEEEEEGVTLGFLEKPKNPGMLLRNMFPSKVGGIPAWLNPVDLPPEKSRLCGFCGEPLQFLLQVYAPIAEKESTFHRMLYVFMCPSMSCLLRDQHEQWKRREDNPPRSIKIFRCQLPRANPFYSSEPPKCDGTSKPLTAGAALCSWCGTWKGEKVCSSCKRSRYCSEKHQVLHWRSGHKNECHQAINSLESSSSTASSGRARLLDMNKVFCSTLWSEYEIIIDDECSYDVEPSNDNSACTSLIPKHNKTDGTYEQLLDKFEADSDKRSWATFQERVSRAPDQVLRYCREVMEKPLWPLSAGRPPKANISRCIYCKGPSSYEFQIMPQLLYFLGVRNDPDSLDWGTIVVYSCSASCESTVSYKEEFVWVQLYPTAPLT